MRIELQNLSEAELDELRAFERNHFDNCILSITTDAFDGCAWVDLVLNAIPAIESVFSLFVQWKKRYKKDSTAANVVNVVVKEIIITIVLPDGYRKVIQLNDVTEDALQIIIDKHS